MTREQWAFIVSLVAMLVIASSYFFKKKEIYLICQGTGIVFLTLSYLLQKEYFAMIGLVIGLIRVVVYFLYERKDKVAPIFWAFLFSGLGIACYFIINLWILGTAKPLDIIYLVGLIGYAFIFRIRNLVLLRYLVTIPTVLSILYNVLIRAVPFVIISYAFELGANLVAIGKYHLFDKKKELAEKPKEKEDAEG